MFDTLHRETGTAPTRAYPPLPIGPIEVHAGVARELRHLDGFGLSGPDAEQRALQITAGKIRNSPVLNEHQVHDGVCHACGEPLDDTRPVVAVLQPHPGRHLWMHSGRCHDAYRDHRRALVDRIMAAAVVRVISFRSSSTVAEGTDEVMKVAGYGADQQTGNAA